MTSLPDKPVQLKCGYFNRMDYVRLVEITAFKLNWFIGCSRAPSRLVVSLAFRLSCFISFSLSPPQAAENKSSSFGSSSADRQEAMSTQFEDVLTLVLSWQLVERSRALLSPPRRDSDK